MKRILILIIIFFPLTVFSQDERELFKRITAQDSGYLQKKEALLILSMAGILDSTNIDHGEWVAESDTLAKYYKRTDNGNYLFAIKFDVDGTYHSHILIECLPQGKVLKKEIYYHGTEYYFKDYCSNFYKLGDFFALKISSNGFPSADMFLYLFKEVTPQNSLNLIPIWHWDIYDEEDDENGVIIKTIFINCSSTMKLEKDSLIVTYITEIGVFAPVENGNEDEEEFKIIEKKESLDVLYIYKNHQWHLADRENLEKLPYWISFFWE